MIFNRRRLIAAMATGAATLTAPALIQPAIASDKASRATAVVERLLADAHAALLGDPNRTALRSAVSSAFAFGIWERYLIGDTGSAFSDQQRSDFQALLPGFLAHLYVEQFGRGLDQPPRLGNAKAVRRDILVSSAFPRRKGGELPVDWRVRDVPGQGAQVIDVMVGGTSFLLLKKEEFGAILTRGGAPALLTYMREKTF